MADDLRSPEAWPPGRVIALAATFDERDNIGPLIDALLAVDPALQVLVVDDDSPDGTGRVALERAEREPRLHVLVRRGRRGLGSATLEGLELARRHGFEIAVNPSGDGSAAVAIGSRRVPGGRIVGWPPSRHVASWLVGWFTRVVLRVPVRDASSGFRAVRLEVLERVAGPFAEGYAFQEDFLWRVHRAGGRIVEVPITFTDRTRGSSKAGLRESCRSIGDLLRLAGRTWLGW